MLPSFAPLDVTGITEEFPENFNSSFVSNNGKVIDVDLSILGRKILIHTILKLSQ